MSVALFDLGQRLRAAALGHPVARSTFAPVLPPIDPVAITLTGTGDGALLRATDGTQVTTATGLGALSALAELEGVSAQRAHQVPAGAVVAQAAMRAVDVPFVRICPWALREGIILRRLDQLPEHSRGAPLGERNTLSELERSRLVRHAQRQELGHDLTTCCSSATPRPAGAGSSGPFILRSARSARSPRSRSIRASFAAMIAT